MLRQMSEHDIAAGAVNASGDAQAFASKIHRGGYATDPPYATTRASAVRQIPRVIG